MSPAVTSCLRQGLIGHGDTEIQFTVQNTLLNLFDSEVSVWLNIPIEQLMHVKMSISTFNSTQKCESLNYFFSPFFPFRNIALKINYCRPQTTAAVQWRANVYQ